MGYKTSILLLIKIKESKEIKDKEIQQSINREIEKWDNKRVKE